MKLAFATCAKYPNLAESDKPLAELFAKSSVQITPANWNDNEVKWNSFDALLIRSIWDYHLHEQSFIKWLNLLERENVFVLNPVPTIKWNHHKFYLKELQEKGIEIIPSVFIDKTTSLDLSEVKSRGWKKAIIKPAISASAYLTRQFTLDNLVEVENEFSQYATQQDFIVQPFMEQVNTQGELSLLFFNRQYSHTVIKTPAQGDFRVQKEYGGLTTSFDPDESVVKTAEQILTCIPGSLLYARVDGILKNGHFMLMELELIEPFLFFDYKEGSIQKFVDDALKMLNAPDA